MTNEDVIKKIEDVIKKIEELEAEVRRIDKFIEEIKFQKILDWANERE